MVRSRVVVDTNVLVSAWLFGGVPRTVLELALNTQIEGVISPQLLSELSDVLLKKFKFSAAKAKAVENKIKSRFRVVQPKASISILKDTADNRVLEAAVAGKCHSIITGDKELLALKKFRKIIIISPNNFLNQIYLSATEEAA